MIATDALHNPTIDTEDLRFDQGGYLLIRHALDRIAPGARLAVCGQDPDLGAHLRSWCRSHGHEVLWPDRESGETRAPGSPLIAWIVRGPAEANRWKGALRAGLPDASASGAVLDEARPAWGLAARGAMIEAGGPDFNFTLATKAEVWAESAPRLYAQAVASQWNPATAIDWSAPFQLPREMESAVVQIMTYLVENENAALLVPAGFIARLHPHFREVQQLLAVQVADEARHIEVFTRRATLKGAPLGLSTVSGRASLKTLLDEPDFTLASFLLSVLGEGTFLNLLSFLEQFAPDAVTRQVARLSAQDEARHVAFGMAHVQYYLSRSPAARESLAAAVQRRHLALADTAGLNEEVFDALVLIAGGSLSPEGVARGFALVHRMKEQMLEDRRSRLVKLGFSAAQSDELAGLHTRNFM